MIPPDVQQFIDDVKDMAEDIEVLRHDPLAGEGDFIYLIDTQDPEWAKGHCWPASSEVSLAYWQLRGANAAPVTEVNVDFILGAVLCHTANYLSGYVIDFTARQFDPQAPWPLVMPLNEWKVWLVEKTEQPILRFSGIHLPS